MKKTIARFTAVAFTLGLASGAALAQTTPSETTKPATTAPADRTSQSGLQPSTQNAKEPKHTGTVGKNGQAAQKKVDDQHK